MNSKLIVNGMIGIVAIVAACFGMYASSYGSRLEFNGGEVFYTADANESDATRLGEYLAGELGFFDGREKSVQLDQQDGKMIVRFCVQEGAENDKEVEIAFRAIQTLLSASVFKDRAIELQLCDERFRALKTLDASST